MAELPGWDRARLLLARGLDVEAARWMIYARVMAPAINEPFEAHLEVLAIDTIDDPKRRARKVAAHQAKRRAELLRAQARQTTYRLLLGLDEPDDEPAVDGA